MPTVAPVRKPMCIAGSRPSSLAAAATRRLARTARPHAQVAHGRREAGADEEEQGAADADLGVVGRQCQRAATNAIAGEDGEGAELAGEVGVARPPAPLGRCSSCCRCLHRQQAPPGGTSAAIASAPSAITCDDDDQNEVATGDFHDSGINPGHACFLLRVARPGRTGLVWARLRSWNARSLRTAVTRDDTGGVSLVTPSRVPRERLLDNRLSASRITRGGVGGLVDDEDLRRAR